MKHNTIEVLRWVAGRRAHDNPRGDFIHDTRDLLDMLDNGTIDEDRVLARLASACYPARQEWEKLKRAFLREHGQS